MTNIGVTKLAFIWMNTLIPRSLGYGPRKFSYVLWNSSVATERMVQIWEHLNPTCIVSLRRSVIFWRTWACMYLLITASALTETLLTEKAHTNFTKMNFIWTHVNLLKILAFSVINVSFCWVLTDSAYFSSH